MSNNKQFHKHIKLISNRISYGPEPALTDEVEQQITIDESGRVCFTAKNYEQYLAGHGFCREKILYIGKWKADNLFVFLSSLKQGPYITDCGYYILEITTEDGNCIRMKGPLIGNIMAMNYQVYYIPITKVLRRYIPVYALWGFDKSLAPDYEGKKEIYLFAKKWEKRFISKNLKEYEFEIYFGEECAAQGFRIECGEDFYQSHSEIFNLDFNNLEEALEPIQDIDLLGSIIFSQYRYITHWSQTGLTDPKVCNWFIVTLRRLKELTKKSNA